MKDVKRAQDLIGSEVYDREGGRIGRVGNVYIDDVTRQPEWVTVRTGLFGTRESFVPLRGATSKGENGINVDVTRDKVKDAPRIEAEQGHLSDSEGRDLYTYYGLHPGSASPQQRDVPEQQRSSPGEPPAESSAESAESAGRAQPGVAPGQAMPGSADTAGSSGTTAESAATTGTGAAGTGAAGSPASPPTGEPTASGPDSSGTETLTRYEEKLRITTEYVESGRVRIRKYVTTERESVTVPITREEIRIEREQIPASEQRSGEQEPLGETEREIVLHEERPIVTTETVAVERIRVNTEQVTEEQTIEGDVRRERFDVDDSTAQHRTPDT